MTVFGGLTAGELPSRTMVLHKPSGLKCMVISTKANNTAVLEFPKGAVIDIDIGMLEILPPEEQLTNAP